MPDPKDPQSRTAPKATHRTEGANLVVSFSGDWLLSGDQAGEYNIDAGTDDNVVLRLSREVVHSDNSYALPPRLARRHCGRFANTCLWNSGD